MESTFIQLQHEPLPKAINQELLAVKTLFNLFRAKH